MILKAFPSPFPGPDPQELPTWAALLGHWAGAVGIQHFHTTLGVRHLRRDSQGIPIFHRGNENKSKNKLQISTEIKG